MTKEKCKKKENCKIKESLKNARPANCDAAVRATANSYKLARCWAKSAKEAA